MHRQASGVYQRLRPDVENDSAHTTSNTPINLQDLRPVSPEEVPSEYSFLAATGVPRTSSDEEASETHHILTRAAALPSSSLTKLPWLPYTLRWIPLSLILAFSLLLETAVVVVHIVSSQNSGLIDDNGSRAIVVGSKFVPTLLAVAYGLLVMVLLDDVKRTEPFARLASPLGTTAKLSLTWTADTWWSALFRSFPSPLAKAKWVLPCATTVFILGLLAVSPLSSTLFVSQDVVFNETRPFFGLDLDSSLPLQAAPLPTTYFRTIANILQNVSTSAWITDEYVVVPFWPGNLSTAPLSPILSNKTEIWAANTTIFSAHLECEPMEPRWNTPPPSGKLASTNLSLTLASPTGCTLDLELGNSSDFYTAGGEIWSGINNISSILRNEYGGFGTREFNATMYGCNENEMLISATEGDLAGYGTKTTNFSMAGQACQNIYYIGYSTATVTLGQGQSLVHINEPEYQSTRVPISARVANITAFDNVFFDSNWTVHLNAKDFSAGSLNDNIHYSTGPANLLAPLYGFSPERMIADTSIGNRMERIRRRFFAEVLRDAFDLMAMKDAIAIPGSVLTTSRRVIVVPPVAITLEVIMAVQAILLATVLYLTRPSRRPLGLTEDPAPVMSVARLISHDPSTVTVFAKSSNGITNNLDEPFSKFLFTLADDQIRTTSVAPPDIEGETRELVGQPADVKKKLQSFPFWTIALFFTALALTLTAIAILYHYSKVRGLYQTFFVYSIDVSIAGQNVGQVSPASVITTLVAVVIGLWWGSFDTTLRRVQPYLALAKGPVRGYKGVAVSYRSSYLLKAAFRAMRRKHWVLFLISTGAFLAEILTIAMSSLWTKAPGALSDMMTVPRALELRRVPMLSAAQLPVSPSSPDTRSSSIKAIFANIATSWMYGATTQLSLQGPEPPWSSDGWSFVPSDISVISSQHSQQNGNSTAGVDLPVNVTMETPAIRARLECSPYDFLDDRTIWLTKWDLTDKKHWNTTLNPKDLKTGYELGVNMENRPAATMLYLGQVPGPFDTYKNFSGQYTTFFANSRRLQCCDNRTANSAGSASIGYWSSNQRLAFAYPYISDTWPVNFTVKWIRGRPIQGIMRAGQWPGDIGKSLIWVDPPQMTALNCQPIIETANSQVTVDVTNGRVLSYKVLGVPRADENAWTSPFRIYQNNVSDDDPNRYTNKANITTSHGVLFVTGLLGAADTDNFGGTAQAQPSDALENIEEQTFNFREPGLNVDYMTYAMLSMVNYDHEKLLDVETLKRTAQRTFSTMFQHFVNNNLSLTHGGYAYQAVGEQLPNNIGQEQTSGKRRRSDTDESSQNITLHISRPVELLYISEPAAWISMIIIVYLIVSCGILAIASRKYNRMLPGPTNSVADAAALVAGSTKLLELARHRSVGSIKNDYSTLAKLGWFKGAEGETRWGIELVDAEGKT
ncbi:hypothetical protein HD806DRAFT_490219 [Xylariaceae sp. AK1471]|nr:hypothetical protein HD806DRAFT_490219 [Xylariaceae sp. AK1471]